MAVAEAGRGRVFGHVPRVHDGEGAVVRPAARVDLAGAAAAAAGGGAAGVETSAVRGVSEVCISLGLFLLL